MRLVYSIELGSFMKNSAMVCWSLVESFAAWTDEDMILVADSCGATQKEVAACGLLSNRDIYELNLKAC
nr:hypothetical protein CFP56_78280 [Quercus suber]